MILLFIFFEFVILLNSFLSTKPSPFISNILNAVLARLFSFWSLSGEIFENCLSRFVLVHFRCWMKSVLVTYTDAKWYGFLFHVIPCHGYLSVLGDWCEARELLLGDGDAAVVAGCHELGEAKAAIPRAVCAVKQVAEVAILPSVLDVAGNHWDHLGCGSQASLTRADVKVDLRAITRRWSMSWII